MGLVARQAEAAGISTLCLGSTRDILEKVNPPRSAFLDFPLGHTTGPANMPELQRAILIEALDSFSSLTKAGSMKELPFEWPENPAWKESFNLDLENRVGRHDTPQFQSEDDRRRWESADRSDLNCDCDLCRNV